MIFVKRTVIVVSVCFCVAFVWLREAANSLGTKGSTATTSSSIELAPVVTSGLSSPVFVTHAGDGSGRLFVLEQPGRIRVVRNGKLLGTPFLDIADRVDYGGEKGLLGLAFHPAYRKNGRYVVNYSRESDGATVVAEYRVSDNPVVSRREEAIILIVEQPYGNHNGGMIAFGQDGYLYIGMGDGGAGGDPGNRGQNVNALLGKFLRIDVDHGTPYAIPAENPFASGGGRPEIFAHGFRNPWRFSFDRDTGRLWAADVGQHSWEEVNIVRLGGNYGWRIMEGAHCFLPRRDCPTQGLELPVGEYANAGSRCSVTGGYVYRGKAIPALRGNYLFGDYCSGEILALAKVGDRAKHPPKRPDVLFSTGFRISSFGEDQAGELYVVDHGGAVHTIIPSKGQAGT